MHKAPPEMHLGICRHSSTGCRAENVTNDYMNNFSRTILCAETPVTPKPETGSTAIAFSRQRRLRARPSRHGTSSVRRKTAHCALKPFGFFLHTDPAQLAYQFRPIVRLVRHDNHIISSACLFHGLYPICALIHLLADGQPSARVFVIFCVISWQLSNMRLPSSAVICIRHDTLFA